MQLQTNIAKILYMTTNKHEHIHGYKPKNAFFEGLWMKYARHAHAAFQKHKTHVHIHYSYKTEAHKKTRTQIHT